MPGSSREILSQSVSVHEEGCTEDLGLALDRGRRAVAAHGAVAVQQAPGIRAGASNMQEPVGDLVSEGEALESAAVLLEDLEMMFVQDDEAFAGDQLAEDRPLAVAVLDFLPGEPELEVIEQSFDVETRMKRMLAPQLRRPSFDLGFGQILHFFGGSIFSRL